MHNQGRMPGSLILRTLLGVTLSAAIAFAQNGMTGAELSGAHMNGEISQARAVAGGVSPGLYITSSNPSFLSFSKNLSEYGLLICSAIPFTGGQR